MRPNLAFLVTCDDGPAWIVAARDAIYARRYGVLAAAKLLDMRTAHLDRRVRSRRVPQFDWWARSVPERTTAGTDDLDGAPRDRAELQAAWLHSRQLAEAAHDALCALIEERASRNPGEPRDAILGHDRRLGRLAALLGWRFEGSDHLGRSLAECLDAIRGA